MVGRSIVSDADPREEWWRRYEAEHLGRGICPASGLGLYPWGNAAAVSELSCAVCDCFGYRREEVGQTTREAVPKQRTN